MKKFSKSSIAVVLIASFVVSFVGPDKVLAATSPSLGSTSDYAIVSSTYTNSLNAGLETTINGDVCYTTEPDTAPIEINGTIVTPCPDAVGDDQDLVLADLNAQADDVSCTDLGTDVVLSGTYTPGCYTSSGTMDITLSTTVTLDGAGTYIFRSGGALTTGDNSTVSLTGGASACDVFWAPGGTTTLGANAATSLTPTFVGNILNTSPSDVTVGHFANLLGRILAFGETVTTDSNTITVPTCTLPPTPASSGGSSGFFVPPVFPLISVTKIPDPLALPTGPGSVTYTYTVINIGEVAMNDVWVRDNKCSYVEFISGDSNNDLLLDMDEAWVYRCTKTVSLTETNTVTAHGAANNGEVWDTANATVVVGAPGLPDTGIVPPLIHLLKVPNIFALPFGGGPVTYTYTVTNPGTEPLNNVSVIDDKCTGLPGRVIGHPGDLNQNNLLESNESWSFICQTNLTQTTTNIGTAQGSANGLTALDFASATIVVSVPGLPNTAIDFSENNFARNITILILIGILAVSGYFYITRRKPTNLV